MTTDYMKEVARIDSGLCIRRAKRRLSLMNETRIRTCTGRLDAGIWTSLEFLKAVSHCMGAYTSSLVDTLELSDAEFSTQDDQANSSTVAVTETLNSNAVTIQIPFFQSQSRSDTVVEEDDCKVCLVARRSNNRILVPCGHALFCESCVQKVYAEGRGCPVCRMPITMLLQAFF
jgi:hypothetical protein